MAIWDLRPKTDLTTGVAVGVGLLAAPVVIPIMWSVLRPVVKAALKGGYLLYTTGLGIVGWSADTSDTEQKKGVPAKPRIARAPVKTDGRKERAAVRRSRAAKAKKSEATAEATDRQIPATE